jgi:hypothetical protein
MTKQNLISLVNSTSSRANQIENSIQLQAITPKITHLTAKELKVRDKKRNTIRKIIEESDFNNESQVILYGNKVAITSYVEPYYTTITESPEIKQTFDNIFNFMWMKGKDPY